MTEDTPQDLPPEAKRALAEAEERRKKAKAEPLPKELGGRDGPAVPSRALAWALRAVATTNVALSPFLDIGKVASDSLALGSHKWLWDIGIQAKLVTFGVGFTFTYGKDLRSGNNVFYLAAHH